MNNYFSEVIARFGNASGLHSYSEVPDDEKNAPQISFVTSYNPSWATKNDESFEGLSRQILFFATPSKSASVPAGPAGTENGTENTKVTEESQLLRDQLNIVGLIRGSCALLSDLGSTNGPFTIKINEGAIVVREIEKGYFLAVCVLTGSGTAQQKDAVVYQLSRLIETSHRTFELLCSPISEILAAGQQKELSKILTTHWRGFMQNFNLGNDSRFGPTRLQWPNRSSHRGFFELLPGNGHKNSSIRIPENIKREIDDLMSASGNDPAGYAIANMDSMTLKHRGILHMGLGREKKLDETSVIDFFNFLDSLGANCGLSPEILSEVSQSRDVFTVLSKTWQTAPDLSNAPIADSQDEDTEDESNQATESAFTPGNALALLNPVTITNSLVVQPITGTVSGFKNLGLAVTEQLYDAPKWLNKLNYFGSSDDQDTSHIEETVNTKQYTISEEFLVGLTGDEITSFLLHMPVTAPDGSKTWETFSLVAFRSGEIVSLLFYESGKEDLGKVSLYSKLRSAIFDPLDELLSPFLSDQGFQMSNSIGSLPERVNQTISTTKHRKEIGVNEIDNDFFFIIYDTISQSYQTSLPNLPIFNPAGTGIEESQATLTRILFHLHDHLINHFILETKNQIFALGSHTYEQLHKFSSSKSSDWLIYSMRHKEKVIIIIKNSTHKSKAKPPLDNQSGHLMKVADSIYAAANLGFMESLGADVRAWLGGVESEQNEEEV